MMRLGESGYLAAFDKILTTTRQLEDGVRSIAQLQILGSVDTSILCFGPAEAHSPRLNIYAVGAAMGAKGWSLHTLQHPPCLHITVCMPHTAPGVAEQFVADLRQAAAEVEQARGGKHGKDESVDGAMHEMADRIRENSVVSEVACTFLDALYKV
jgi:glutamate/tyrosine decarboxylase-like PLP-dependent enzyme